MYLDKEISKDIIKELSPFINFDLNIIDHSGIIVASTDNKRENTKHQGANILITKNLSILCIYSDDMYEGCKKGVNLPIVFENRTIGVIGITGEPDAALKYGRILQKMTEMLIYENFDSTQKNNKENSDFMLVTDLIHGRVNNDAPTTVESLIRAGLRAEGPFIVALFSFCKSPSSEKEDNLDLIRNNIVKDYVMDHFNTHHILCARNENSYIMISNYSAKKLIEIIELLSSSMKNHYNIEPVCSIGGEYNEYIDIPKSYNEALIVNNHIPLGVEGIFQFSIVILDLVIHQISVTHKKNLFYQVFKECNKDEINEICDFTIAYFECNGSLSQLAENEYIHKNTVQYRINKIKKKTTLDIRKYHDLFVLYLAASYNNELPSDI
ncbi:MAG: hypothetical protein GX660_28875 [Clostridiaceae bacterium]|nr:hypothetical protein [Clostridiaceae bacterium]